jgi:hypothetical protein
MVSSQDNTYSVLVDKGAVVEASYLPPELPKFGGNPLIEALPPINSRMQAIKLMQRFPDYDDEMRLLPRHLRTHAVMDLLRFFQPLPIHLRLEGMISRMLRDGYLSRNPMDPSYAGTLEMRLQYFKSGQEAGHFAPTAAGFSILGMSGVGKSTGLCRVLHLYPQIILHSNYKGRNFTKAQIVWLTLECPKDGSTRALCLSFFEALDALLGTTYKKDFDRRWRNTNELSLAMPNIASRHHLGMLGIDEIQNLSVAKSGGVDEMLNFFVNLVNTIGLPVVLIGNYQAADLLGGSFRQARRGSGQGDLVWDWMGFDEDWKLFVEALWKYQYVRKKCRLTSTLSFALHEVSYGVADLAIRMYLAAQIKAIDNGLEMITEGLLRSAYRDDFRLMSRIVEVLKSGDSEAIQKLGDVSPPPAILLHEQPGGAGRPAGGRNPGDDARACPEQGAEESARPGPASSKAEPAGAVHATSARGRGRSSKGKRGAAGFEPGDLRGVVARGALSSPPASPYQSLAQAGYIKPSREFLD